MRRQRAPSLLLLSVVVAGSASAGPSASGTLKVKLVNEAGGPIAGASVRVTVKDTWQKIERKTDDSGAAFFYKVPSGEYRLTVEAEGFGRYSDARECQVVIAGHAVLQRLTLHPLGSPRRPPFGPCPALESGSETSLLFAPGGSRPRPRR